METGLVLPAYQPADAVVQYATELDGMVDTVRLEIDDDRNDIADRLPDSITVNVSPERRGKGRAVRDGADALETDIMGFVDADGSIPAEDVQQGLRTAQEVRGLVAGYRRERTSDHTALRAIASHTAAAVARQVMSVRIPDYQCGFKAWRQEDWAVIRPEDCLGYAFDLEIIERAAMAGLEIHSVPVRWDNTGASTLTLRRAVPEFLRAFRAVNRIHDTDAD